MSEQEIDEIRATIKTIMQQQILQLGWTELVMLNWNAVCDQKERIHNMTAPALFHLVLERSPQWIYSLIAHIKKLKNNGDHYPEKDYPGWQAFIQTICSNVEEQHPAFSPMQLDPRIITTWYKLSFYETLERLTCHAVRNQSNQK